MQNLTAIELSQIIKSLDLKKQPVQRKSNSYFSA